MRELFSTLKAHVHEALVICLWFLLASTGYLLWLHRVLGLAGAAGVDFPLLALGYLAQALGIGAFLVAARKSPRALSRRTIACELALHALALLVIVTSGELAVAFVAGWLANMLAGAFQGCYLMLLASRVDSASRGTVFGCGYAASTFLTLLVSLPAHGALTSGVSCLVVCLLLAAVVFFLLTREDGLLGMQGGDESTQACGPSEATGQEASLHDRTGLDRKTAFIMGAAIVVACFVHAIGFSFPVEALASNVSLELSRVLYGVGIAIVGIAADHDRRIALVACAASLVMPFFMLALSGAGAANALLWAFGYLLTGAYVLFSAIVAVDLAADAGRFGLAGTGMFARYVGDAAGASLCFAFSGNSAVLIALSSVAFLFAVALFALLYLRVLVPQPNAVSEEQRKSNLIELFAADHGLTLRERDVLRLVVAGKSNSEIGGELVISERTVKFHMTNLLRKTGCKTRLDIIALIAELEASA